MAFVWHSQETVPSSQKIFSKVYFTCVQIKGLSGSIANILLCFEVGSKGEHNIREFGEIYHRLIEGTINFLGKTESSTRIKENCGRVDQILLHGQEGNFQSSTSASGTRPHDELVQFQW